MGHLAYVVVSTPRSATLYTARLLTALGLACGHEAYFTPKGQSFFDELHGSFGDSSWLAAPFLMSLPQETVIFHQIRDPVNTINSMIYTKHLSLTELKENPYVSFLRLHAGFANLSLSEEELACEFWCTWHQLIEKGCEGRRHLRYKIEDMSSELLRELVSFIPAKVSFNNIIHALARVPEDCNTRGRPSGLITGDTLPLAVSELAAKYGYYY
jgi:hypothetical protein